MISKIIILISIVVLISVHVIEFWGFEACDLCLKQRWAWYLTLIIAIFSYFITINYRNLGNIFLYIVSIILFCNAIFAAWHAGIEWGFWPGLETCNSNVEFDSNNLIESLKGSSVAVCNNASFRILGISLAGYNFIISLLTSIFILIALRKNNGSKKIK